MNPVRIMQAPTAFPGLYAMSFALRLITLRRERNLTQQEFADTTGIHVQQIKRYEAGSSQPSAEALKKIAKAFGITTDWLLFEDSERGPDENLRLQFEAVSQLPPEEQSIVKEVLDSLIIKYQTRRWDSMRAATAAPINQAVTGKRTGATRL
jgi:transcriptional regulator with XRE-family HTH domain